MLSIVIDTIARIAMTDSSCLIIATDEGLVNDIDVLSSPIS